MKDNLMNGKWILCTLVCGLMLLVVCGCGSSTSISGSVTYEGESVASGSVSFLPSDGKGPSAGGPITDGRYEIKDITPGEKIVKIIGINEDISHPRSSEEMAQQAEEALQSGNGSAPAEEATTIPPNAEGNNEKIDISSGTQIRDFHLTAPKSNTTNP